MFSRRAESTTRSFSKGHKVSKPSSSFRESGVGDDGVYKKRQQPRHKRPTNTPTAVAAAAIDENTCMRGNQPNHSSNVITLVVGADQRLFAAHEHVLSASPFFARLPIGSDDVYASMTTGSTRRRRVALPDEEPEIFSAVLEYLYTGDYTPRLRQRRSCANSSGCSWELETDGDDGADGDGRNTVYHRRFQGDNLLKDTVIYCAAERYGLPELKKIALRKQGLHSGIQCGTVLASARYAYAHTPDSDARLRAHYLALIIRSRATFKRSGTMQLEMHNGGSPLFFDLFVALCNHLDDVASAQYSAV